MRASSRTEHTTTRKHESAAPSAARRDRSQAPAATVIAASLSTRSAAPPPPPALASGAGTTAGAGQTVQRLHAPAAPSRSSDGSATADDATRRRQSFIVQRIQQIQGAADRRSPQASDDPVAVARQGTADAGEPLPQLDRLQQAFGPHDLSSVRVHRGPAAQQAASALSATAFTHGEHIALSGPASLHTLAHEAAHVVQQRQGGPPRGLSQPGDASEQAADAVAKQVVDGGSAAALLGKRDGGGAAATAAADAVQRMVDEGTVQSRLATLAQAQATKQQLQDYMRQCLGEDDVGIDEATVILHWFIKHSDQQLIAQLGGREEVFGAVWNEFDAFDAYPQHAYEPSVSHHLDDDQDSLYEQQEDLEHSQAYQNDEYDDIILPADDLGLDSDLDLNVDVKELSTILEATEEDEEEQDEVSDDLLASDKKDQEPEEALDKKENQQGKEKKEKKEKKPKMDTIAQCLAIIHKAYVQCDAKAMMTEKLMYAFTEDRDYVQQVVDSYAIESQDSDPSLSLASSLDASVSQDSSDKKDSDKKDSDKKDSDKKGKKEEKKLRDAVLAHRKHETDRYQKQFSDQSEAEDELKTADGYVTMAAVATAQNYRNRERLGVLHELVSQLRETFPKQGMLGPAVLPDMKKDARRRARQCAELAIELSKITETNYAEIRNRKAFLIKQGRIAPEFSESPKGWGKVNLGPKLRNKLYDIGYGLISVGVFQVKDEYDYRGYIMPAERTDLVYELKDAYGRISVEYQTLRQIKTDSASGVFDAVNWVVRLLQTFDRGVLAGAKRVIRHLKYYMTALAAVPVAAPIAGAIAAVLSAISGGISLLQVALNGLVTALRSMQIWQGDPTVENLLRFSRRNATIQGLFSTTKLVVESAQDSSMASGSDYVSNLKDTATLNQMQSPLAEDQEASSDDSGMQVKSAAVDFGINTAPDWTLNLIKEGVKEYGKAKVNYVKAYGPKVKGSLGGSLDPDEEQMDPETVLLFRRGMARLQGLHAVLLQNSDSAANDMAASAPGLQDAPARVDAQLEIAEVKANPANDPKQVAEAKQEAVQTASVLESLIGSTLLTQKALSS